MKCLTVRFGEKEVRGQGRGLLRNFWLTSETSPYRIAEVVGGLEQREDWATDENGRNVFLTEWGFERVIWPQALLQQGQEVGGWVQGGQVIDSTNLVFGV